VSDYIVTDFDARRVLAESFAAIIVDQESQNIVWSNPLAERSFGETIVSGLNGSRYDSLMPERFRAVHESYWSQFWDQPQIRMMLPRFLDCRRSDGSEFKAQIILIPCKLGGKLCCMVVFIADMVVS